MLPATGRGTVLALSPAALNVVAGSLDALPGKCHSAAQRMARQVRVFACGRFHNTGCNLLRLMKDLLSTKW